MQRINRFIRKIPFFYAFAVLSIALACAYFLFRLIFHKLLDGRFNIIFAEAPYYEMPRWWLFFGVLVVAPLVETLLKIAVYHLLRLIKWLRKRECYIVLIIGVLFGLWHFFSLASVIAVTIAGIFFMYAYTVRRRKGGYWMAVLLHIFYNGMVILVST